MPRFEIQQSRFLAVSLAGEKVLAKAGSMVASSGALKYERALLGGEGLLGALKRKAVGSEAFDMMVVSGNGTAYLAAQAAELLLIELTGESVLVEAASVLAIEPTLSTDTAFAGLSGMAAGQGLFSTTVSGRGTLVLATLGEPVALAVTPATPLFVDPGAFVAAQGGLSREIVMDASWRSVVGHSSGESYQFKFTGTGTVYIQPCERA